MKLLNDLIKSVVPKVESLRDVQEVQTKTRIRVILDTKDDQEWLKVNYLIHYDPVFPSGGPLSEHCWGPSLHLGSQ